MLINIDPGTKIFTANVVVDEISILNVLYMYVLKSLFFEKNEI